VDLTCRDQSLDIEVVRQARRSKEVFGPCHRSCARLRLVFKLPLRQSDDFLRSLLKLMDLQLDSPDHTTLLQRAKDLSVDLRLAHSKKGIHLIEG